MKTASVKEQEAAKKKWQAAANAYEVLSDPTKRARYDSEASSSSSWSNWGQQSQQGQQGQQQANAQNMWSNVTSDAEVIEEAINEYALELQENAELAAAGIAKGDFTEVEETVLHRTGVLLRNTQRLSLNRRGTF